MLKLITYPPAFGAPSASPFCVKAMCLLKMAGVEYEAKFTSDPRKAPKNKLPVLIDGDQQIADSDVIRAHLETTTGIDFDAGLTPVQRATSRAVIRMVEEHLYFALVCDRWLNDDNWPHVKKAFFSEIPAAIRGFVTNMIRKKVRAQMVGQGMGRHSPTEQLARADADLKAISGILANNDFLFGATPSAADASVMPVLGAIAGAPTKTALCQRVTDDSGLMAYISRAQAALLPV